MSEPILGGIVVCRPAPISYESGVPRGFTLMSDLHIGAPQVDYALVRTELETARERGDRVLINGDVFDLICWQDRKRYSPDAVHPRLRGRRDLIPAVIEWGVEILAPYADLLDVIGCGNHDEAATRWHNVDPVALLIHDLRRQLKRADRGHTIHHGGYCGFVDYRFREAGREDDPSRNGRGRRWVIYYHHGGGGAAPVTKGMIDFNRRDTFVDSDVIWLGHKHNRWSAAVEKLSCPLRGDDVTTREVRHVMTGAYYKTYVGQSQQSIKKHGRRTNYAADAGMAPQGKGGARVEVTFGTNGEQSVRVIQ